jgi:ankyrin repeat protein
MLSSVVLVGLLLSQAATPARATPAGADLIESAKNGDVPRARDLLARGAPINASDRRGFTSLMWAAAGGSLETVQVLLEGGAAVERRASDGTTALMLASANGFTEIVRALIVHGSDPTAVKGAVKARQLALENRHPDVAALLEQAESFGTRMLQAATEGNDTLVRQLLAQGAPANMRDDRGATVLMIAARNGDLGMMQTLLSRGADASIVDNQGQTVFGWAEPSPTTAKYVTAFLIDHGISKQPPRLAATPQSPQVKASLAALSAALARVPPASASVRTAQRRADAALSQLQMLAARWPANSPDDYRDNLSGDVTALDAVLKGGTAESLAATLQAVAEDLEVKLEHCNLSGGKLGGSVVVRVRTVAGTQEKASWQVFYMPRVFEAAANASPDLFPQLSSPTVETLVPGRYVMWVRDPATARLGERTVVKVGEGKKELLLDLPVPAVAPR